MEWKLLDQEVAAAKGLTHAALLLGEQPPKSFQPPPGTRDIRLPTLTALDWMRRGLLAERLFHDDEALLAYKVGGSVGGQCCASSEPHWRCCVCLCCQVLPLLAT
jgi:hypothetical protein